MVNDNPEVGVEEKGFLAIAKEIAVLVISAIVLAVVVKTFLFQAFYIPSGSMLETLQLNDRVLVEKVSYLTIQPKRGDVIVFRRPGLQPDSLNPLAALRDLGQSVGLGTADPDKDLIKRIIGLPGETVEIKDGHTFIDGEELNEPYLVEDFGSYGPYEVPENEYFMMGDNRPNSLDSRFTLGTVPRENIIGKAFMIMWPLKNFSLDLSANHLYDPSLQS